MTLGIVHCQQKARKTSFQKSIYFQSLLTELSFVLTERSPSLSLSLLLLPDKGGLLCLQDRSHHFQFASISLDSIFGFQFQRQQNLGNTIFLIKNDGTWLFLELSFKKIRITQSYFTMLKLLLMSRLMFPIIKRINHCQWCCTACISYLLRSAIL